MSPMSLVSPTRRAAVASSVALVIVACGGSAVTVGKTETSDQQLQTKKDGSPTGDGSTCSWADTALYDQVRASSPTAPVPTYKLGDDFTSIDGCNSCTCAARGIMCTVKTCDPVVCDADALLCPDGTTVGRSGPKCEFRCPGQTVCTDDAKKCPDGSFVGRTGPNCEFACPGEIPIACPAIQRICADGTPASMGPGCEQICPAVSCQAIESYVGKLLTDAVARHKACNGDADCTTVAINADCVDQCTGAMNKTGATELEMIKKTVNDSNCQEYKKQGCTLIVPPCVPPTEPKCVDKVCQ
ncbi:MAG: hypothetical protein KIT84_20945 [Labilithrix sp.]|nr:hypothetical protein [Labilithrix sp.]MCW5813510.1 hypothetical protein [Labilithrix sp.]